MNIFVQCYAPTFAGLLFFLQDNWNVIALPITSEKTRISLETARIVSYPNNTQTEYSGIRTGRFFSLSGLPVLISFKSFEAEVLAAHERRNQEFIENLGVVNFAMIPAGHYKQPCIVSVDGEIKYMKLASPISRTLTTGSTGKLVPGLENAPENLCAPTISVKQKLSACNDKTHYVLLPAQVDSINYLEKNMKSSTCEKLKNHVPGNSTEFAKHLICNGYLSGKNASKVVAMSFVENDYSFDGYKIVSWC